MSENDFPNHTADERSDADFLPFDETTNRSRMAREAKIGLSVIFILLVVLGFVVYDRMTRPDETPEATAGAEGSQAEEKAAPASEEPKPEAPPIDWTRQMAMDTKAASDAGETTTPNGDSWGLRVEERQASKPAAGSTVASVPPAYMPQLVAPSPTNRYPNYRDTEATAQATDTAKTGQSEPAGSAGDRELLDRYPKIPIEVTAEDAGPGVAAVADTEAGAGPKLSDVPTVPPTPKAQASLSWTRPADKTPPAESSTGGRYADRYAPVDPPTPSAGEAAVAVETPRYGASPRSSYPTQPDLSVPRLKIGAAAGSRETSSVAQQAPAQIAPPETTLAKTSPVQATPMENAPSPPAGSTSLPRIPSRDGASTGTTPLAKSGVPAASTRPQPPTPLNQRLANAALAPRAGTYVVQPNDSYWTISQRLYGTGGYFRALAQCNRNTVPDQNDLRVGSQILAPEAADLERAYPDLCPTLAHRKADERRTALGSTPPAASGGRVYVVQEGDNLFDIARHELGKPTRWPEIVNLNQELLGSDLDQLNYLTPGMRLVLPDHFANQTPAVTQQPGSLYRR